MKEVTVEEMVEVACEQVHAEYRLRMQQYEQRFKTHSSMCLSLMQELEESKQVISELKQKLNVS